jgi:outer membrane protein assembly factor BamB
MMSGWGNSESLLVDGENLICTPGGKGGTVLALNKKTGETVWRSKDFTDAAAYASPIIEPIRGVRNLVIFTDKSVAGLNPADGSVYWRVDCPGKTAVIPTPVVYKDHVFVSAGYGVGCSLFKIVGEGKTFAAEKVYSSKDMVNHHGGLVLLDGNVYGYSDGKGWTCMDVLTGKVKWKDKDVNGKGTLTYADGCLYTRAESGKGTIVLLEANPEKMVEKGRFDQPNRTKTNAWPHLVVANGKLYVRDQDTLLCYDVKAK